MLFRSVENSYMKSQLVESNARRLEAIERGEQTVVGVNRFVETEASPLEEAADAVLTVSKEAETDQIERLNAWRAARNVPPAKSLEDIKDDGAAGIILDETSQIAADLAVLSARKVGPTQARRTDVH